MKLDHHEEVFRNRLQRHEVPVDTSTLWKSLSPIINPAKKKRRPIIFWWIFGNGLVIAAITFFVMQHYAHDSSTNAAPNSIEKTNRIDESKELTHPFAPLPTPNANGNNNPVAYHEITKDASVGLQNEHGPLRSNHFATPKKIASYITTQNSPVAKQGNISSKGSPKNKIKSSSFNEANHTTPLLSSLEDLALRTTSPLDSKTPPLLRSDQLSFSVPMLKLQKKRLKRFNFLIEAGVLFYTANAESGYEFSHSDANSFLASNNISSENKLINTQFLGLGVQYNLSNAFYLRPLLAYHRSTSSQQLNDVIVTDFSQGGFPEQMILSNRDSSGLADVDVVDINLKAIKHSLDCSFSAGYQKVIRRFSVNAEVGVHANIGLSKRGNYISQQGRVVANSPYSTKLNTTDQFNHSFRTSLRLGYNVLPSLNLFLGPSAQFYGKKQYANQSDRNSQTLGLMLGARYKL